MQSASCFSSSPLVPNLWKVHFVNLGNGGIHPVILFSLLIWYENNAIIPFQDNDIVMWREASSIISGVRPLKQEMEWWAVVAAGGGEEC